jgi:hypothetical protein
VKFEQVDSRRSSLNIGGHGLFPGQTRTSSNSPLAQAALFGISGILYLVAGSPDAADTKNRLTCAPCQWRH